MEIEKASAKKQKSEKRTKSGDFRTEKLNNLN